MRRRTRIAPLVGALLFTLAAIPCGLGQADAPAAVTLRLMAYNIHHGEGTDRKFDLERIAELIKAQKPDLVAVQEVDVKTRRASGVDQAAKLAELTGMHIAFGKFMDYSGGQYGQAVLSRFPIKSSKNHPLPAGPEPRTALEVRVDVPFGDTSRELVFVGNHLYQTEAQRLAQAEKLVELFGGEKSAVVLAGDFNTTPVGKPMALLRERWVDPTMDEDEGTWPAWGPEVEIDYVLYPKRPGFRFVSSEVIAEKVASDHRPLVTVVEWEK